MSGEMPRYPLSFTAEPTANLIPAAGGAVCYMPHGSLICPIEGAPPLVRTLTGSAHANEWDTLGMITFPLDHTSTNIVQLQALDDEDEPYNDSQISLVGMQVGDQFMSTIRASYTQAPGGNSFLWAHGADNGTATMFALMISPAEAIQIYTKGKGGTGGSTTALTAQTGTTFTQFKNQGIFDLAMSLRPVSPTTFDVELRMSNGTLEAHYTASAINARAGSGTVTENPGISGGVSAANFYGLTLGGRFSSAGVFGSGWGRGSAGGGNLGRIGTFCARKFASYDANLCGDVLSTMRARPHDFVRLFCSDH